jgi:hypothetical protein
MNKTIALAFAFFVAPFAAAKPAIVFSGTDVAALTAPAETVRFTIVAADGRNGGTDLAGVVLTDPETGAAYGGFSADTEKGSYSFEISLSRIFRVRPIEPSADGWETRAFRATVIDAAGDRESVDLFVDLYGARYEPIDSSLFLKLPAEVRGLREWNKRYVAREEFEMPAALVFFMTEKGKSTVRVTDEAGSYRLLGSFADSNVGDEMYRWMHENGFMGFVRHENGSDFKIEGFGLRCRFLPGLPADCWKQILP